MAKSKNNVGTAKVPTMGDDEVRDVRLDQAREALEHAQQFPHGNAPASWMPERDEAKRLTRAGMEAVIAGGGTVVINGVITNNLDEHFKLVAGDDRAVDDALRGIEDREKALQAEKQRLLSRHGAVKRSAGGGGKTTGGAKGKDARAAGADARAGSEAAAAQAGDHAVASAGRPDGNIQQAAKESREKDEE